MGNTQVKIDLKEVQDDLKQLRDDLNKLTDANTQVQENLREFRDANKIELQEIRDELKESRRERAFEKGRYFVRMDALWNADQEKFYGSEAELRAFRTEGAVVEWYRQLQSVPVPKQKSQKSDFPDEPMFPGSAVSNNDMPSLAHLLPKDRSCTMFYGNAIALITGYSCNDKETNCLASDSLRHLIEGSSKTKQAGIKNSTWNYLHLPGNHSSYFDHLSKGNGLIITPIWNPAVEWCPGQSYEILVVAVRASTYMWMGLDPVDMDEKKWLAEASVDDLDAATGFLRLVVKALADQLVSKEGDAFFKKANEMEQNELELLFSNHQTINSQTSDRSGSGSDTSPRPAPPVPRSNSLGSSTHGDKPTKKFEEFKDKLKDLQNVREKLRKAEAVAVPTIKIAEADGANNSRRVLKVDFAKYFLNKPESIPDPFLLALKAAISWSSLQETKLLPSCSCALVSEDEPVRSISFIEDILCTPPYDDDDCSVLSEENPSVSAAVVSPDSGTTDKLNFW